MVPAESRGYKRPESVLVVVYTRAGRALMLRRADFPEFWQSITGSMEWTDETPLATAVRELREETGLDVAPEDLRDWHRINRYVLFPHWRHKYAPGTVENTEHAFSLELGSEVPIVLNPAEHSEYVWMPLGDAARRAFSWTNRDALLALEQAREGAGSRGGAGDGT
ncbi:MAG: dihydroneopterin triphosphate diphosphatase [Acidiferrobacterales bacterium]